MATEDKTTVLEIIEELSDCMSVFQATSGECLAYWHLEGYPRSVIDMASKDFTNCLRKYAYDFHGKVLNPKECENMKEHFEMLAWQCEDKISLYHRTIYRNKAVYYDLDGERTLKVTESECTFVKLKSPLFLKNGLFAPQVEPDLSAEPQELVEYVKKHFHLKKENDCILLCVFLITCFWGKAISHPILQIYGEKGSAKTTTIRQIQDLIDCKSVDIADMPRRDEDIALCLSSQYLTCFDNISYIPASTSDLLCINCTGGSRSKRKLFKDKEQSIIELKSVVCLNGTCQNIVRSDLADRTIFLELERIRSKERKSDRELESAWKSDRPKFFGALLKAVQGVLADRETQPGKSIIRLADFYELAIKAGVQIGYEKDAVVKALRDNQERMANAVLDSNIVVTAVVVFMDENLEWKGTMGDFYRIIKYYAIDRLGIDSRDFPRAANSFSRELSKNESDLEHFGIVYKKARSNTRDIQIRKVSTVSTEGKRRVKP